MERFKENFLKCFRLRKGLREGEMSQEDVGWAGSQEQAVESMSCSFRDNTKAHFLVPVPAVMNTILHFIVTEKHPKE